jgi:hypothetical protein
MNFHSFGYTVGWNHFHITDRAVTATVCLSGSHAVAALSSSVAHRRFGRRTCRTSLKGFISEHSMRAATID